LELKEIEININELELRLDRLRALYDQYFMGYEKLEPQTPRKDVERRFHMLRKENFRNTALRFRLNVAIQKYSTYQSYWQRICRQIEEGTYKRHIQKAKAKFAEGAVGRGRKRDADLDIDVDVDLAELDEMTDEEFLSKLHDDDKSAGADDDGVDTVRPPASQGEPAFPSQAALRSPPSFRSPRWDEAPNTQPTYDPSEHFPSSAAPYSLSPDTQPQAFRPMSVQEASQSRLRDYPPATDPAPPPSPMSEPPRGPQIRQIRPRESLPPAPANAAPARPVGRPAVAAKATPGELSEDRIRQIYAQYVREKRSRGESTATTTFESVARSLRTSSEKLRGQHGGRDVDFEVAEKDGRTILRPIVK
jgi:hypothetical protein